MRRPRKCIIPLFLVLPAFLLFSGCESVPNPDLSLNGMEEYQISMAHTIDGAVPHPRSWRPLEIEDHYSSLLFSTIQGKTFALAPDLKLQLGNERNVSSFQIKTYSNFWETTVKICTLWLYEPRTIKVTGKVWLEEKGGSQ